MKKGSVKKILLIVGAVLAVIVVAAVLCIDYIAKFGIQAGASGALGVPTRLDQASIGIFSGRYSLRGLNIANPEGFASPRFLRLDQCDVSLSTGSLLSDKIVLPRFVLKGIELTLENNGKQGNYDVILENLRGSEAQTAPPTQQEPSPKPGAGGKKFLIEEVVIQDVTVHADVLPIGGQASKVTLNIPEIRLQNLGSDTGGGAMVAQISGSLMKALLTAVVAKGGGLIPDSISDGLESGLGKLDALGTEVIGEAGKAVDKAAEDVGKAAEKVGETLDNLFKGLPGKKD